MRRLAVLLLTCAMLMPATARAATVPTTTFPQVEADPPIAVPATPSCTEQVVVHDFQNSYYAPGIGSHTPPAACPGPWSKVVLTLTGSVGGVQFDRLVDVYVGQVPVLSSSTSEPCCISGAVTTWSVPKDITEYAGLLASPQTVTVFLNNVFVAGQYTGIYHVTVSFTFYTTGPGAAAATHPDVVTPVGDFANSGGDGYFSLGHSGQQGSAAVTLPRNLTRLTAELFAQGHGPCEEFWWSSQAAGTCLGNAYREVAIYLDGTLAGAAPVYPVVFTGANGPGLWEPIPSPRAWNLRPSVVDLTPLVGTLVDGRPHTVAIAVLDAAYAPGDYWLVGANLLGWVDPHALQTHGGLLGSTVPPAPTESGGWDPTGNLLYTWSASHHLSWTGWVQGSGAPATTIVQDDIAESTSDPGIAVQSSWQWTETVNVPGGQTVDSAAFSISDSSPGSFQFVDSGTSISRGARNGWTSFYERLTTAAVGLAMNGVERESYLARDFSGSCYDRTLTAAGGLVVQDQTTPTCPAQAGPI